MRRSTAWVAGVALLVGSNIGLATRALACDGYGESSAPGASTASAMPAEPRQLSVAELALLLQQAQSGQGKLTLLDANGTSTRQKFGVIPGAVLLTSAVELLPRQLPADKATPLVFYCANEHCRASHLAAAQARELGYRNIAVLPAGIMGWKNAGMTVVIPTLSEDGRAVLPRRS